MNRYRAISHAKAVDNRTVHQREAVLGETRARQLVQDMPCSKGGEKCKRTRFGLDPACWRHLRAERVGLRLIRLRAFVRARSIPLPVDPSTIPF